MYFFSNMLNFCYRRSMKIQKNYRSTVIIGFFKLFKSIDFALSTAYKVR